MGFYASSLCSSGSAFHAAQPLKVVGLRLILLAAGQPVCEVNRLSVSGLRSFLYLTAIEDWLGWRELFDSGQCGRR